MYFTSNINWFISNDFILINNSDMLFKGMILSILSKKLLLKSSHEVILKKSNDNFLILKQL